MVELYTNGAVAELADAHDSKSCELSLMWVRPPPAPPRSEQRVDLTANQGVIYQAR